MDLENRLSTPRGSILIRAATPEDAAAYRELRLEALENNPTAFSADYPTALALPMSYWSERLARATDDSPLTFFALAGQDLVGMATIVRRDSPKTRHGADIFGMYVRPDWRGLRIADALVNACLEWGRAHGIKIVMLSATVSNTQAIHCYARCGFTVYGIEPQSLYHDNIYYDELLMARTI